MYIQEYEDLRTYFSVTEWARLVKAEKGRLKNMKRNHLTMLAIGKYHLVYAFARLLFIGIDHLTSPPLCVFRSEVHSANFHASWTALPSAISHGL